MQMELLKKNTPQTIAAYSPFYQFHLDLCSHNLFPAVSNIELKVLDSTCKVPILLDHRQPLLPKQQFTFCKFLF